MLVGVILYDQLFFRPLLAWADKIPLRRNRGRTGSRFLAADVVRRTERFAIFGWGVYLVAQSLHRLVQAFARWNIHPLTPLGTSSNVTRVWDAVVAALVM